MPLEIADTGQSEPIKTSMMGRPAGSVQNASVAVPQAYMFSNSQVTSIARSVRRRR
jgi:hypothetical protein